MYIYIGSAFAFVAVALLTVFILAHKFPQNSLIQSCCRWQSLLGAVAALFGVAIACVAQSTYQEKASQDAALMRGCSAIQDQKMKLNMLKAELENTVQFSEIYKGQELGLICWGMEGNVMNVANMYAPNDIHVKGAEYMLPEFRDLLRRVDAYFYIYGKFKVKIKDRGCMDPRTYLSLKGEFKEIAQEETADLIESMRKFLSGSIEGNDRLVARIDALSETCSQ